MSRLDRMARQTASSLEVIDSAIERERNAPSPNEFDEYARLAQAQSQPQPTRADGCSVELIAASSITPEPISWLWPGWLARGKLHIEAGPPSTGKTTLALAKAATVTRGGTWPDGTRAPRGWVVMWSGEDDVKDTLVPRMIAAKADLNRVRFVGAVNDETGTRAFDPGHDVPRLAKAISRLPEPPALLIVDPIVSAVTGDSHKNAETRRALAPLVDLARQYNCAVIGITHFTKGTAGREPLERVTGSLAFGAVARIVMATVRRPDDHPDGPARLLVRAKSNIGPDGGGFHYQIEETELDTHPGLFATRATWGDAIEGTARSLLCAAEADLTADADAAPDAPARTQAENWLRDYLAKGPLSSAQVVREAAREGVSERTLHRARRALGVESTCSGFGRERASVWSLPAGTFDNSPSLPTAPNKKDVAEMETLAEMDSGAGFRGGAAPIPAIPATCQGVGRDGSYGEITDKSEPTGDAWEDV